MTLPGTVWLPVGKIKLGLFFCSCVKHTYRERNTGTQLTLSLLPRRRHTLLQHSRYIKITVKQFQLFWHSAHAFVCAAQRRAHRYRELSATLSFTATFNKTAHKTLLWPCTHLSACSQPCHPRKWHGPKEFMQIKCFHVSSSDHPVRHKTISYTHL